MVRAITMRVRLRGYVKFTTSNIYSSKLKTREGLLGTGCTLLTLVVSMVTGGINTPRVTTTDFLPEGAIVSHGGSLGLSKLHYDHYFENAPDLGKKIVLGILNENYGPLSDEHLNTLGEWYDHRSENPFSSIGDHFFLDQRRASWGTDNRFAEDAFSFEWHIFANSWPLIDAFLSAPKEARAGLKVQKRAIDLMTPHLNKAVPEVNSPMGLVDRWRGRFSRRGMQKLKRRLKGSS